MKKEYFYLAGTVFGLGLIYILSLSPFIQSGDSGEFVITSALLRVPHPPGYPLYTYIAHLFSWLPVSTMPWRIGLFSVVAQLGAAILLFHIVYQWLKSAPVAVLVTLGFSLSPTVWTYATEAEVFALNNFLTLIALSLVLKYDQSGKKKWAYATCFAAGFAFSHHQTSVLVLFPVVAYYLFTGRTELLNFRSVAIGLLIFVSGLLPYLLLFPLAKNGDILSWGDITTWKNWFTHVSRGEYGTFRLSTPGRIDTVWIEKLAIMFKQLTIETAGWGVVGAILASRVLIHSFRKDRFASSLGVAFVFYSLFISLASNADPKLPLIYFVSLRMWIPALLLVWMLAAFALIRGRKVALVASVVILCAHTAYLWHSRFYPRTKDAIFESTARSMLENVAPNSIVLLRGDLQVNITRYTQSILGFRPDVYLLPLELLSYPWSIDKVRAYIPDVVFPHEVPQWADDQTKRTFNEFALANINKHPIYLPQLDSEEAMAAVHGLEGFITGFTTRVYPALQTWTLEGAEREIQSFMQMKFPKTSPYPWYSWEHFVRDRYFHNKMAIGASFAYRANGDIHFIKKAEQVFKMVMEESEDHRVIAKMQIAWLYTDQFKIDAQHKARAIQEWKEYLQMNTGFNAEANEARAILSELEKLAP